MKEKILEILEENAGEYISGEKIACELGVTRSLVGKAVGQLRADGYKILAETKNGYCFAEENDYLSVSSIRHYLNDKSRHIEVFKTINSTNTYAKELSASGAYAGAIVAAEEQTCGRGRQGKSFYSPKNTGVYFSLILTPDANALFITVTAAVAAVNVLSELGESNAKIKWVNDIFIASRKVCGILTEAQLELESCGLTNIVMGMGINISNPENGFPREIKDTAGVINLSVKKSELLAKIVNEFERLYRNFDRNEILSRYREKSNVIGNQVTFVKNGALCSGKAVDIDDEARLVVIAEDGERLVLSSGEISIKISN